MRVIDISCMGIISYKDIFLKAVCFCNSSNS